MDTEETVVIRRSKQICPECHRKTLVLRTVMKPREDNPVRSDRYRVARCEGCGYTSLPRKIDTRWEMD